MYEDLSYLFGSGSVAFKQEIDIWDGKNYRFTLKIYARYEGLIAKIAKADVYNWDENHWRCQYGANAGDFEVDPWIKIGGGGCSTPWLEFKSEEKYGDEVNFSNYLEQLSWELNERESSEEDSDNSEEDPDNYD